MGMFDSIYLRIECPYCEQESEIECQTKELECMLDKIRVGDFIGTKKYNYLDTIADCQSDDCIKYRYDSIGYHSGFGRFFRVRVFIKNGKVTGEYEILTD